MLLRLADAVALSPQEGFVGESEGGAAAMLGAVDIGTAVSSEVRDYVATLLRRDDIAFDKPRKAAASAIASKGAKTHAIKSARGSPPELQRIAFACGCRAR